MENIRKYGKSPFRVVVIHGGPGAAGEMAPVARELSHRFGVLEPLQTAISIEGQIDELKRVLEIHAVLPVVLIGFSWGAWLSLIFASKFPELVKKLILISSGPFEQKYADLIQEVRLSRLNKDERSEVISLLTGLNNTGSGDKNTLFEKVGKLLSKADAYNPVKCLEGKVDCNYDIFQNVWAQAAHIRESGELLKLTKNIKCPVVAVHGDYDSHPAEGVEKPLTKCIRNFRFILLKNCGHKPWIEKRAKDNFYAIIKKELE